MKRKSKITHAQLLAEGVVWLPKDDARVKPVADVKPTALDVVVRPPPKVNTAPRLTDPPARKLPQGTHLMRAINANIIAQGGTPVATPTVPKNEADEPTATGLQRAIAANVEAARKKS
jgi:hypothetical protein